MSAVTARVAAECRLNPTGIVLSRGISGEAFESPAYSVAVRLPGGIEVDDLAASVARLEGADVLLGMDIIGHGDFVFSGTGSAAILTFHLPAQERSEPA